MLNIEMANVYAIRVHELGGDFRGRVVSFVEATGGSYVVARETDATREHFQGWLRCDVKPQTLRVRFKKAFPECVGNKSYSISAVKDFDAYSRYVLKGTREEVAQVVCYRGIELSADYLQQQHRAYWSKAEKPGKSNRSLVEEVHEWVCEQSETVDRRTIARRVCDTLAARKRGINTFYVRSIVNTVQWLTQYEAREIICDEISNKW